MHGDAMKRLLGLAVLAIGIATILVVPTVGATASLRVSPLEYRTTLADGEKKQGVIDIANPDDKETVTVTVVTQGFKQLNDKGELGYYDDSQIAAGLIPDLRTFELKPHETQRMAFLIDGAKLPAGDVFGALLFTTSAAVKEGESAVQNTVRLGVLFSIVNGTPSEWAAEITSLTVPFLQIGDTISGVYTVKNTGDPAKASGFFPEVTLKISPFKDEKTLASSLVFPGIERENTFSTQTGRFGFFKVSVQYGDSVQERWVFIASPQYLLGGAALVAIVISTLILMRKYRRGHGV